MDSLGSTYCGMMGMARVFHVEQAGSDISRLGRYAGQTVQGPRWPHHNRNPASAGGEVPESRRALRWRRSRLVLQRRACGPSGQG